MASDKNEEKIELMQEQPSAWRSTSADRPQPNKWIVILDDSDRIYKGYMRKFFFAGHTEPTYSFHGEFYDFQRNEEGSLRGRYVYCLVNAVAWMPMPKSPEMFK